MIRKTRRGFPKYQFKRLSLIFFTYKINSLRVDHQNNSATHRLVFRYILFIFLTDILCTRTIIISPLFTNTFYFVYNKLLITIAVRKSRSKNRVNRSFMVLVFSSSSDCKCDVFVRAARDSSGVPPGRAPRRAVFRFKIRASIRPTYASAARATAKINQFKVIYRFPQ